MAKRKNKKLTALDELFGAVCDLLKERLDSSEATPQDVKNAIQFLKDNGISAMISEENDAAPLNKLIGAAQDSGTIQFPFVVQADLLPPDDPMVKVEGE